MRLLLILAFIMGCSETSFQSGGKAQKRPSDKPAKEIEPDIEIDENSKSEKPEKVKKEKNANLPPQIVSKPLTTHKPGELLQDPKKFDLRTWKQVNFGTDCGDSNPEWKIEEDFAYELHNAEASALISDIDSVGVQIEGKFSVGANGYDDDYIGIVFGFQDVKRTYLFDWKKREQGQQPGMCLQSLEFQREIRDCDLFLGRNGYAGANVRVIECANTMAWQVGKEYTYILNFRPGNIEITVKDGDTVLDKIQSTDSTYKTGKFGLYANSQDKASFTTPTVAPVRGDDYVYEAMAEDPEQDALTWKLVSGPNGMQIDESTGKITWKAEDKEEGEHEVVIEVRDTEGNVDKQSYTLSING